MSDDDAFYVPLDAPYIVKLYDFDGRFVKAALKKKYGHEAVLLARKLQADCDWLQQHRKGPSIRVFVADPWLGPCVCRDHSPADCQGALRRCPVCRLVVCDASGADDDLDRSVPGVCDVCAAEISLSNPEVLGSKTE